MPFFNDLVGGSAANGVRLTRATTRMEPAVSLLEDSNNNNDHAQLTTKNNRRGKRRRRRSSAKSRSDTVTGAGKAQHNITFIEVVFFSFRFVQQKSTSSERVEHGRRERTNTLAKQQQPMQHQISMILITEWLWLTCEVNGACVMCPLFSCQLARFFSFFPFLSDRENFHGVCVCVCMCVFQVFSLI